MSKNWCRTLGIALAPCLALLLSGCKSGVLSPQGSVGEQEKHLILLSTGIMLAVVVPVIVLTLVFAWRYRASNTKAKYAPKWAHSTPIELVVWGIPTLIIVFLAVLTWRTTHELDPYKPLASNVKPIDVDVVSLDWKWLFIYPDLHIATVNQLAMPVGTPVNFHITSDTVMNSFFIPQLGSQVYSMAGMVTQLHLIAGKPGNFQGMSANFSGPGFSDMTFRTLALPADQFDAWVQKVRSSAVRLDAAEYQRLARPSEANPVQYFSQVSPHLFDAVVTQYDGASKKPMRMSANLPGTEH